MRNATSTARPVPTVLKISPASSMCRSQPPSGLRKWWMRRTRPTNRAVGPRTRRAVVHTRALLNGCGREGVARLQRTLGVADLEPLHPRRRGPVGPLLLVDAAGGLLLDAVVA